MLCKFLGLLSNLGKPLSSFFYTGANTISGNFYGITGAPPRALEGAPASEGS
jgi:hypothetical protein